MSSSLRFSTYFLFLLTLAARTPSYATMQAHQGSRNPAQNKAVAVNLEPNRNQGNSTLGISMNALGAAQGMASFQLDYKTSGSLIYNLVFENFGEQKKDPQGKFREISSLLGLGVSRFFYGNFNANGFFVGGGLGNFTFNSDREDYDTNLGIFASVGGQMRVNENAFMRLQAFTTSRLSKLSGAQFIFGFSI